MRSGTVRSTRFTLCGHELGKKQDHERILRAQLNSAEEREAPERVPREVAAGLLSTPSNPGVALREIEAFIIIFSPINRVHGMAQWARIHRHN